MTVKNIQLGKLLRLMFCEESKRVQLMKADIQQQLKRKQDISDSRQNFNNPLWADVKSHIYTNEDLQTKIDERIAKNSKYKRLYKIMEHEVLLWWKEKRRHINYPIHEGERISGCLKLENLNCVVRVGNFLSISGCSQSNIYIYPYFAEETALSETAAKLGLYVLQQAFPNTSADRFSILDIYRGKEFSLTNNALSGEEVIELEARYAKLISEQDTLRQKYG